MAADNSPRMPIAPDRDPCEGDFAPSPWAWNAYRDIIGAPGLATSREQRWHIARCIDSTLNTVEKDLY